MPITADLTEAGAAEKVVAETLETLGGLHILVNNAGMNIRKKAHEVNEEEWDRVVDLNLKGAFFLSQAAGKVMCEQRYGRIVNIASVAGLVALRTGVAYGASKAGVIQMTRVLALEWSKFGVNVNAIAPWYFRTPLTEALLDDEAFCKKCCSGRRAEELAMSKIWLVLRFFSLRMRPVTYRGKRLRSMAECRSTASSAKRREPA